MCSACVGHGDTRVHQHVHAIAVGSMGTIQEYSDPLLDLLHLKSLNKDEESSNQLIEYIDNINDIELKKWCIDSLTILRNLEKIETALNGWEFYTLNFREPGVEYGDEMSAKLAKRVLKRLNSVRQTLITEKPEINTSVQRARKVSKDVSIVITDAGTILVELTMRIVKLAKNLDQEVTIRYSRAKLTIIGYELNKLALENIKMDKDIVKNYRIFVNNLLNQLNAAVDNKDTVGLWESVAIVGDVEKMFNSMKEKNRNLDSQEMSPTSSADSEMSCDSHEKPGDSNFKSSYNNTSTKEPSTASTSVFSSAVTSPSTVSTEHSSENAVSAISAKEVFDNDKELLRTNISDHIPSLMSAFKKQNSISKPVKNETIVEEEKIEITTDESPSIVPSLLGTSILGAFYKPNVKDPIYINKEDIKDDGIESETSLTKSNILDPSKSLILQQLGEQIRQKKIGR